MVRYGVEYLRKLILKQPYDIVKALRLVCAANQCNKLCPIHLWCVEATFMKDVNFCKKGGNSESIGGATISESGVHEPLHFTEKEIKR